MPETPASTVLLQLCLDRMRAGDRQAREELLRHTCGRLERLTRKLLRGYPGVRRWAQTDDVLQSALIRLLRALESVQPESLRAFFGLAAVQIRRELLDLTRHYYGPQGMGANHASAGNRASGQAPLHDPADGSHDPGDLAEWCEFHERVGQLPDEEREVVDLLYYQGLSQVEASKLLDISIRTVQRRWQSAMLRLHDLLNS